MNATNTIYMLYYRNCIENVDSKVIQLFPSQHIPILTLVLDLTLTHLPPEHAQTALRTDTDSTAHHGEGDGDIPSAYFPMGNNTPREAPPTTLHYSLRYYRIRQSAQRRGPACPRRRQRGEKGFGSKRG